MVNWDAVGAVAELLGALGVIVSLVYLALQIRQNSTLLRQTSATERANAAVVSASQGAEFTRAIALDADASRIWAVGFSDPDALDPDELARFDQLMFSQLIQIDVNHFLGMHGPLDRAVHAIWDKLLDGWITQPRFRALWDAGAIHRFTTEYFCNRVREKLAERAAR